MSDSDGYAGQAGVTAGNSDHNVRGFQVKQHTAQVRTTMPVKIVAVHGGGVGPAGTVDVMPLINQTDGDGNPTPHATVYGLPWARDQSANGAILNDPVVGDIGQIKIHDRDISGLGTDGSQVNPGSNRRSSPSDGVYHGALKMPGTPKQYVQFRSDGVTVMDTNGHSIQTFSDKVIVAPKEGSGAMVYLGGDGKTGSYDFVMTASGPSRNVLARIG